MSRHSKSDVVSTLRAALERRSHDVDRSNPTFRVRDTRFSALPIGETLSSQRPLAVFRSRRAVLVLCFAALIAAAGIAGALFLTRGHSAPRGLRTAGPAPSSWLDPQLTIPSTTAAHGTSDSSSTSSEPALSGPACQDGQLAVTAHLGGAAAGSVSEVIVFTNTSDATCTVTGYPGVAALNSAGVEVLQAKRELNGMMGGVQDGSPTPPTVALTPGAVASARVEGGDNPIGAATSCPSYPYLLVTPPGLTRSVRVTGTLSGSVAPGFPGCIGITVNPVVPGSTGYLG